MAEQLREGVLDVARAWMAAEPDEDVRRDLEALIVGGSEHLDACFSGTLTFGTAGLRAAIGPGPMRMNRLVVRQAAAGLADHLLASDPAARDRGILIGFDARHKSKDFAFDTARVAAARGLKSFVFEVPVPTPVLAWNVARLGVSGAVMVTASHNPAGDNGYKVYRANGSQIVAPVDADIESRIRAVDPLTVELAPTDSPLIAVLDDRPIDEYLSWVPSVRLRPEVGDISVAYTAMHGVGGDIAVHALHLAGFSRVEVVGEQHRPDPEFPTVAFPNPEEPGAMDFVIDLARRNGCAVALANDPDADRLGVGIEGRDGTWRRLAGDEIGWLLADHILSNTAGDDRLVVTTLVSSSLLEKMARDHGVAFEESFTGFKWIASAVERHPELRLVFAYEQALGYLVASRPLDKDGISAAVVMAEIAALAHAQGASIADRLEEIAGRYGRHITAETSIRISPANAAHSTQGKSLVDLLLESPPEAVLGRRVLEVVSFPEATLARLLIEGAGADPIRIQVRPSGTEPKVKVYAEAVGEDPAAYLAAVADGLRAYAG